MNKFLLLIILLIICIVFLVSCNGISVHKTPMPPPTALPTPLPSPTPTKSKFYYDWKSDWLNSRTCAPPCWEGITPGQTSFQEAMEILTNMPSARSTTPTGTGVQWEGKGQSYYGNAALENESSRILYLFIRFNLKQNISLEEALSVFGDPLYVHPDACAHGRCEVYVIYPESGLALMTTSISTHDDTVMIDRSSEVQGIKFFIPGIDNYLKLVPSLGYEVRKWEGYGTYPEVPLWR